MDEVETIHDLTPATPSHSVRNSEQSSNTGSKWKCCHHTVPRDEIQYFVQIILVYLIVIASMINLSLDIPPKNLWISLASAGTAYILPQPVMKHVQSNSHPPHTAEL